MKKISIVLLLICSCLSIAVAENKAKVQPGAESVDEYLPLLKGKRVGVLSNQTGVIGKEHIVDFLHRQGVNIVCIFSPEHGFRGMADAGEHVSSSVDQKTGIPIKSLYDGNTGKPSDAVMQSIDVLVFDLQDVGLRFYTYLTTMVRMMDACAANHVKMVVLDRPNPNGHYVDGPILDLKYRSSVGWVPVPVVHGMTLGELAGMVNGEKWLTNGAQCDLKVVKCKNYTHATLYKLPIAPSPNLKDMRAVYLYPSLCYFEATPVSLGRGTDAPFEQYGHPDMKGYAYSFTPRSMSGAKTPPQLDKLCYGVDLRTKPSNAEVFKSGVNLSYLIDAYSNLKMGDAFFTKSFERLIGVDYVRKMIEEGKSAAQIKACWKNDVEKFKQQRKPYLLYPEK
jgi:uncharacterized protein YbbC (DUF1343 family)